MHKRNKDGTYNITFDDGDSDRRVKAEDVGVYNPDDFEVLFLTLCVSLRADMHRLHMPYAYAT